MAQQKVPFEKIRSQIEKKKIFNDLINLRGEVLCKAGEDCLFRIKSLKFMDEQNLVGECIVEEGQAFSSAEVIGNFSIEEEKMFFQTNMKLVGKTLKFAASDCDIYKLQRRSHFRIEIAGKRDLQWTITQFEGHDVFMTGMIQDISAGGCKIQFPKESSAAWKAKIPNIEVGNHFKGQIHFSESKVLDIGGIIRHQIPLKTKDPGVLGEFGVEFINLTPSLRNRLSLITLDLQKKLVLQQG